MSKYADVATQTDSMGVEKSQPAADVAIGCIPTTLVGASRFHSLLVHM